MGSKQLINNLLNNINENNSNIIKMLSSIIINNSINSLEDLKKYEINIKKINGKTLTTQELVKYAKDIINSFPYDIDSLDYDDTIKYIDCKNIINTSIVLEDVIINLIKIFDLTHREMYFPYEAYQYIITNKL